MLETKRLFLRPMTPADYDDLRQILQDDEVMYAYGQAFSDEEVRRWLTRQIESYRTHGFGLWAVVLRESGAMIGQCGLTYQDCDGRTVLEIGYLFKKSHWHRGYASEAAGACRDYAFEVLGAVEVYALIRDTNLASQRVARRIGMELRGHFTKHYRGIDMLHEIYAMRRP